MSRRINIGNANIVRGTCELGNAFGQIESATWRKMGDEDDVPDCGGGIQAHIISNPRAEFELTAIFPSAAALPTLGQAISFPAEGVTGNVLSFEITWESAGSRKIKITAGQWESLGSNPTVTEVNYEAGAGGED